MAGERIAACASYLVENATPHIAEVVRKLRQEPRQTWDLLLDQAFDKAHESLCPIRVRAILGPVGDDWTKEAYVSAGKLCFEAIVTAVRDQRLWDRRKTDKTRQDMLYSLAQDHIVRWSKDRGMDLAELLELRDGGDE